MVNINYYKTLDDKKRLALRNKIIERTGISLATFYYKLSHGNWKKLEKQAIEEATNELENENSDGNAGQS